MKINFFQILIIFLFLTGCRDDDTRKSILNVDIVTAIKGNWSPSYYESKGKIYQVPSCQSNGRIFINSSMSGGYDVVDVVSGSCQTLFSTSGIWNYDRNSSLLILTYTQNSLTKTIELSLESVNDSELRILDNTKNLDGILGVDEAVLVYKKN